MPNWRKPLLDFYDVRMKRNPAYFLPELQKYYDQPIEPRRQVQMARLSRLLLHAAHHVPYYRDLLLANRVVENEKIDLGRFSLLPQLRRETLRVNFERLKSDDLALRDWYKNSSGGSTGEPVVLLQDREYHRIVTATTDLHFLWAHRDAGDPFVQLWGSERDLLAGTVGWRKKISGFFRNVTFLNSIDLSVENMRRYIATIQRLRPVVIEAYAGSIYDLARYANASKVRLSGVKSVVTSAETLYPYMREEIERAFGCPVLNRYGSREVANVAAERTAGIGLDVFTYTNLVEVVDAEGRHCQPGEEGDILVTCLANYAMPIIRYRIGDRGVVGALVSAPTPSVERLAMVTGRAADRFLRRDGSTVDADFFVTVLGAAFSDTWLKKIQLVQQDYELVVVKLVASSPPPQAARDEIRGLLQRVMTPACRVIFEIVPAIPPLASGKYASVVSHVAQDRNRMLSKAD